MSDEYTPTTARVRESFVYAQLAVRGLPTNYIGSEHGRAFDRWLTAHDAEVAHQQVEHDAATHKDSLTVRTVEELDALPVGTLIEAHRKAIYRRRRGAWSNLDGADRFQPNVGWLPATVLWTPEEAGR